MIPIKKIQDILQNNPKNIPKHVVVNISDHENIADNLKELFLAQVELSLPILSVRFREPPQNMIKMLELMIGLANEHKARIVVLGKWYSVPGEQITLIKKTMNDTKDYDSFFLNLFINYDPQHEIADACKVMVMKVVDEKLKKETLTPQTIKDNLYTSYFIPPELVIEQSARFSGTMLWDSPNAVIFNANKEIISKAEFNRAIDFYSGIAGK